MAENTLVVIRHGSTHLNGSDECIRGWLDVPLSPEGIKEVRDACPAIKRLKLDGLIASDLQRAEHTAEIISRETGVPLLYCTPDLRPWHLGDMAGKKTKACLPRMLRYIREMPDEPVPGGESFNEFKRRCLECILKIQADYPDQKIGIITHHRCERLMDGWRKAGQPTDPALIKPEAFEVRGIPPAGHTSHEVSVALAIRHPAIVS